ncbi:MAG: type II toxin-antitoxin system Phd/YefM family antitoxin [Armatimonadota bacterium]
MSKIKSSEAQSRFSHLLDTVQTEPVTITKRDRPVAVIMSPARYAELEVVEDAYWTARAKCAADHGYAGVEETADFIREMLGGNS